MFHSGHTLVGSWGCAHIKDSMLQPRSVSPKLLILLVSCSEEPEPPCPSPRLATAGATGKCLVWLWLQGLGIVTEMWICVLGPAASSRKKPVEPKRFMLRGEHTLQLLCVLEGAQTLGTDPAGGMACRTTNHTNERWVLLAYKCPSPLIQGLFWGLSLLSVVHVLLPSQPTV